VGKVQYKLLKIQYGASRRSDDNIKVNHIGISWLDMIWIEVAHDEFTGDLHIVLLVKLIRIFLFPVGHGNKVNSI
jgi:hypothetical protein